MALSASLGTSVASIASHIAVVDGKPTTTTRDIAEVFGKRHDHVLNIVRQRMAEAGEWRLPNFWETVVERANPSGGEPIKSPVIRMTEKGFMFVVQKFTGKKAVQTQIAYVDEFERMRTALTQPTPAIQHASIDPAALLLSGQCAPVPLTAAQQALVSDHAWKLAGEALKLIEQHLLRRVAYCGIRAHSATLADVDKAVSSVTLGQALTHHHQTELHQVLKTLQIAKSFADTALQAVQQAIHKNEGGAA